MSTLRLACYGILAEKPCLGPPGSGQFKRSALFNQTLEPTQVAGFNQLFDDPTGTKSERWGVGIDHRFSPVLTGGVEISQRNLRFPVTGPLNIDQLGKSRFIELTCNLHRIHAGLLKSSTQGRISIIQNLLDRSTPTPKLSLSVFLISVPQGFLPNFGPVTSNKRLRLIPDLTVTAQRF